MFSNSEGVPRVGCKRNGVRFDVEHDCTLYHNDIKYPCKTKNISFSGMLISAQDFPPESLKLGDTCSLSLSTDPAKEVGDYSSKVTRIGISNIALCFLGFIH